jgi:lysyl endopeptidase
MYKKMFTLLVLALALAAIAAADTSRPMAVALSAKPLSSVQSVDIGPLNLKWLDWEDSVRERQNLPPRFAVPHSVRLTPRTSGTWEKVAGGLWLWRLRVRAEKASSINLGFTRFRLPAGARLQIYSADLAHVMRPFTAEDNEDHGQLWTPAVPTGDLVIELATPESQRGAVELELGQIGQGYKGFGAFGVGPLKAGGSCNMDVECLNSVDPWRQNVHAVGRIQISGGFLCTGSLVNNTAKDRRMYFITAQHCGIDPSNAASVVIYWNFQNSTCRTPGTVTSGSGADVQFNQFHTGAFFRAESSDSDFTLIELDDPPVPAYNHYWAGWDRSSGDVSCPQGSCFECSQASLCTTIHHASGGEKRITFAEQTIEPSPDDSNFLWVHWDPTPVFPPDPSLTIPPQATEPGSSGAPLYNTNRRFVGQLLGGPSACGQTGDGLSDYYGRFSVSWSAAAPYLDPANTGALVIDGRGYDETVFADGFESGNTAAWSGIFP